MSTVAERVAAGIQLLDDNVEGWRDKINLETFNIQNTRNCILGQIFKTDEDHWESGYDVGRAKLNLAGCDCCAEEGQLLPYDYGFDARLGLAEDISYQFRDLQSEWEFQLALARA